MIDNSYKINNNKNAKKNVQDNKIPDNFIKALKAIVEFVDNADNNKGLK